MPSWRHTGTAPATRCVAAEFPARGPLDARARRLAAQRCWRARASRGVVAAQRQLGPRREMACDGWCARRSFAAATIGTLTIGLGMFAVVYTAVQKVLIEPMPYRDPDDLYSVWRDYGPILDLKRGFARPGPMSRSCRKPARSSRTWRLLQPFLGDVLALREGGDPREIAVTVVSPNLFDLLGVKPMLGRGFAPTRSASDGRM